MQRQFPGHHWVSAEIVDNVRTSFVCSPQKSVCGGSWEIGVSQSTVSKVLGNQLRIKAYRI